MTILLVTKDLFFVPTLRSAAAKLEVEVAVALSIDSAKLDALHAPDVRVWVIDLSSVTIADLPAIVASFRLRFPQAQGVAFGPHVQEQRLQAARAAGCQHVLTRGQFDSQLDRLLPIWIAT